VSAVSAAVRKALTALGAAVSGLVPTQVGAAMAAAEHEGFRAVAGAHPPLFLVADEHDDHAACLPCKEIANTRYETLDEALEDYVTVGYKGCLGGVRCRGRLRSVWREDPEALTESAPAVLAEADGDREHTGAMLALVPSEADAARLAVDGGEPASELHCTIAYLGKADQFDTAARQQLIAATTAAVRGMPVVEAEAFGVASFGQAGGEPCNVLNVGGDMLDAAHHFLTEFIPFEAPDQHAPWHAHVTLEYTDDLGRLQQHVDRLGPVRFDRVRLAVGGDVVDIPLLPDDFADDDGFEDWLAGEGLAEADVHPGDGRLKRYWLGKGLGRWAAPGVAHPWTTLYRLLRPHIKNTVLLKKTVSRWYIDHFGHTPNQRVAEAYHPEQLRDPGGEHGGQWIATPGMSWADVLDSYGPAHDEASSGDFTVAVFERGDFTLFHKTGDDRFEAVRELDADYAGELAGRLDQFADDAETADPDPEHAAELVDYLHIGDSDALVGRTGDGQVVLSASKSGDREPDLHVIGNPAADQFHLDPDAARALAVALRDMADRFDEVDGRLVESVPRSRRQSTAQRRRAVLAETEAPQRVQLVETGALDELDGGEDDAPLTDEEYALLIALDELDGTALAEVFDASQARYPKGHPLGGKFRPMADRVKQSIADHRAGKHGDKHPLDGYSREQLRRVAKARGVTLQRGEGRDSIAAKLLDDHAKSGKPGGKKPVPDKAAAAPAVPDPQPKVAKPAAEKTPTWDDLGRPQGPAPVGQVVGHEGGTYERLPGEPRRYRVISADGRDISGDVFGASDPNRNQTAEDARTALRLDAHYKARVADDAGSNWRKTLTAVTGSWRYDTGDVEGFDAATPEERDSIRDALARWTGDKADHRDATRTAEPRLNMAIRGAADQSDSVDQDIRALDLAFTMSKTKRSVTVYRGYSNGAHILPPDWRERDLTGLEWSTDGYTPTTADVTVADEYVGHAADGGFGIRLKLPKGTPAIAISDAVGGDDNEGEILLPRKLRFRAVKDSGPRGGDGSRWLDVELVAGGGASAGRPVAESATPAAGPRPVILAEVMFTSLSPAA
jgi:hypothetical protein